MLIIFIHPLFWDYLLQSEIQRNRGIYMMENIETQTDGKMTKAEMSEVWMKCGLKGTSVFCILRVNIVLIYLLCASESTHDCWQNTKHSHTHIHTMGQFQSDPYTLVAVEGLFMKGEGVKA